MIMSYHISSCEDTEMGDAHPSVGVASFRVEFVIYVVARVFIRVDLWIGCSGRSRSEESRFLVEGVDEDLKKLSSRKRIE